jgi:N-dimethylarginine dimethylaminohydrolase
MNDQILMSDTINFSNLKMINPYYNQETIDLERAKIEHDGIRQLLISAGIKVTKVDSPAGCQDGVYTANWALVRGDTAVMSNLPNAREDEENYAERVLADLGKKIVHIPKNLKFSGQGDALACGDLLFCGSDYRSDEEAQKIAAEALGYTRIQLKTIPKIDNFGDPVINEVSGWPDSYFYDLDLALAIIKPPIDEQKGLIAYCPEAFTPESCELLRNLDVVDKIEVSIDEAKNGFATNLVSNGKFAVMSNKAPNLASEIRRYGVEVLTPNITELAKGGGYIRCITLTIF